MLEQKFKVFFNYVGSERLLIKENSIIQNPRTNRKTIGIECRERKGYGRERKERKKRITVRERARERKKERRERVGKAAILRYENHINN